MEMKMKIDSSDPNFRQAVLDVLATKDAAVQVGELARVNIAYYAEARKSQGRTGTVTEVGRTPMGTPRYVVRIGDDSVVTTNVTRMRAVEAANNWKFGGSGEE